MTRSVTIYMSALSDRVVGDHQHVKQISLPPSGHLLVRTTAATYAYAAGEWGRFVDEQDAPEQLPDQPLPDPLLSLPAAPFDPAVHEAMQILCVCADLRCPVVLNAASTVPNERAWSRLVKPGSPGLVELAPAREQCVHDIGHDAASLPHVWTEGGWPFGPAEHHPRCPRHPERYNRPAEEGQPAAPAGSTSAVGIAPAPESDTPVVQVHNPHEQTHNMSVRLGWGYCAAWGPIVGDRQVFCTRMPHDDTVQHVHNLPGGRGERTVW